MAKKVKTAEEIRAEAIETARIVDDAMRSIASSLQEAFGEAGKEIEDLGKEFAKEANRGLKGLKNNAEALYDAQEKAKKGLYSSRDIQKEIEKKGRAIFIIETKIADAIANGATNGAELNKELAEAKKQSGEFLASLKESEDKSKAINKAMGLTGAGLKGMKNIAGKLGLSGLETVFEEASDASAKMAEGLVNTAKASDKTVGLGGKMQTAFKGVKVAAIGIGKALMDPLFILGAIVKSVKFLVGLVDHVRKLTRDVGRSFGMGAEEARELSHQIEEASLTQEGYYHTAGELLEASNELNSITALNLAYNQKNAETFRNIAEYQGLGVENAKALFNISTSLGTPFENISQSVIDQTNSLNKSTGNYVKVGAVIDQMANASADTRMSFRGNFEEMVKTAHIAARLGTSMEAIKNASRKTLDFQSSIEAEMQAEAMLGKNLNLEKLRSATLTRDTATMAAEQTRLVKETMGDALNNQLVLEDTAAALGMSTDEYVSMAEAIQKNGNLSEKQRKEEQKNQEKAGKTAADFERTMLKLGDSVKKMFLPLAEGLEPAMQAVANAVDKLSTFLAGPSGKIVGGLIGLAAGGTILFKAGKSLVGLFTDRFKQGATPINPLFVHDVNGGNGSGGDMLTNTAANLLGKRWTKSMGIFKNASKFFGGKNTMLGRGLRDVAAMFGKRSSFVNQIVSNSKFLSKMIPSMSKLTSKLPDVTKAATGVAPSIFGKSGSTVSKLGTGLKTFGKVLGPIAAVADLAIGGYTGYEQSKMSAKDKKAAGIREDIGAAEATTLGVLTGGAEKGSVITDLLGGEKGSAGDELLGIGMSAGRGALAGAAIGSVVPVIGTAVGGAIGAVVGTVSEGFKVFSDPNSSLRKGLDEGLTFMGNKAKEFGNDVLETGKELAKGAVNLASKTANLASEIASDAWTGTKDLARSGYDSFMSLFANGGIAPGGFKAFANGGAVSKPTLGLVGEGRYNEAIIPLPDGKSVPVQMSGGSGNSEVVALLKELITVVKNGGDIYMDGAKIGKSMVMSTSRMG